MIMLAESNSFFNGNVALRLSHDRVFASNCTIEASVFINFASHCPTLLFLSFSFQLKQTPMLGLFSNLPFP